MPDCVKNGVSVKIYADDSKLYNIREKGADLKNFEESLHNFENWSEIWQLKIAFSKCNSLSLGYGNTENAFELGGTVLENVTSIKDLGILISNDLKPGLYCNEVATKACARMSLIFRIFSTKNTDLLVRAYTTFVRPILEYETPVWSPYYTKDIERIEQVQRAFTRRVYCRCSMPKVEYQRRLETLGLESLEARRVKNDLVMCFKILKGFVDVDRCAFFDVSDYSKTRNNGFKLKIPKCRLDLDKYFFSTRVCKWWNALDSEIVATNSAKVFSNKLTKEILNNFTSIY